ncbi:MAG: DUF5056 domain-containing protein [Paludibacteraceae bacterium]
MENKNDKVIAEFFKQNKTNINDDGFTKKVICSLPEKEKHRWIIPVSGLLGFYIALSLIDMNELFREIRLFIETINPIYFIVAMFFMPLVCLALWFLIERKHPTFG